MDLIRLIKVQYLLIGISLARGGLIKDSKIPTLAGIFVASESEELEAGPTCFGTLINSDTIITSAHCLYQNGIANLSPIRYQIKISGYGGSIPIVSEILVHPGFDYDRKYNDLAFLMLSNPVWCLKNLAIIETPESISKSTVVATLQLASNELMTHRLQIRHDCADLPRTSTLETKTICASEPLSDQLIQPGHSGSPVLCYDESEMSTPKLCGVISSGSNDSESDLHTIVFATVSSQSTWVSSILNIRVSPPPQGISASEVFQIIIIVLVTLAAAIKVVLFVRGCMQKSKSSQLNFLNSNSHKTIASTETFETRPATRPLLADSPTITTTMINVQEISETEKISQK